MWLQIGIYLIFNINALFLFVSRTVVRPNQSNVKHGFKNIIIFSLFPLPFFFFQIIKKPKKFFFFSFFKNSCPPAQQLSWSWIPPYTCHKAKLLLGTSSIWVPPSPTNYTYTFFWPTRDVFDLSCFNFPQVGRSIIKWSDLLLTWVPLNMSITLTCWPRVHYTPFCVWAGVGQVFLEVKERKKNK